MKKIKINPLFWLILGIGVVTGYFREVVMVFVIVFIHELGHGIAAHLLKWEIKKIELLPFGGVAEVEESDNRPFYEEMTVILAGPLQHLWMIGLSYFFFSAGVWSMQDHQIFVWHNLTILFFNLLPVLPLDGGRLMQLACMRYWSYHKALDYALVLSTTFLVISILMSLWLFPFHLNLWVVLSFLIVVNYLEYKQKNYRYIRFLTERLYDQAYLQPRHSIIVSSDILVKDVIRQFRRGYIHTVFVHHKEEKQFYSLEEQELLHALFEKKQMYSPLSTLLIK
ncbi:M50 family metallopeptidase [Halalkalibacterium ligniniphilum]|uniref:M50 family metallopeptidase n=1 Tax=Halalkalibacterium ligniniphilum TaxID=1134413 RepID=UPI001F289862|nr:M50 family metallopeptidase [Halalkalibacterium ligniniphilum]